MENRENIDKFDNLVQAFDEQMSGKANGNTKGTAYFLAAICLFKGLNADETKDFAKAGARVFRKLKEYEMIRISKFSEDLFIETILDLYHFLSLECMYQEIDIKDLFVLRDSFRGEDKWKD